MTPEELTERLADYLKRATGAPSVRVEGLRRLTGGASREIWSFDAVVQRDGGEETMPLVLRMDPRGGPMATERSLEFKLLKAACAEGVKVPEVKFGGDESLESPFFIMERIEGETIARRLLRDEQYAETRRVLPEQLAGILARIHRIPIEKYGLEGLPSAPPGRPPAEGEVKKYEQVYRMIAPEPHPVFELTFRWLAARMPPGGERALVHGDYRIGNVIFGPEGARSILDWELAHIGDPMEDLGWICVRSWRFGGSLPVGGIGEREPFFRAYEAAGGHPVDVERVRFWEVFGNVRWGIICISQARTYLDGRSKSVELASIGRRISETEWELLNLMEGT